MHNIYFSEKLFPNPIVLQVEFSDLNLKEFQRIKNRVYKTTKETWGCSILQPVILYIDLLPEKTSPTFYHNSTKIVYRAYFCFKDEIDALQIKLINENVSRVYMWPKTSFQIHEYTDE